MLTEIKNAHTYICWPIKINLCLVLVDSYQVFIKYLLALERWIRCKLLIFLGSVMGWTIEIRCLFRRFFIVLPKILLFMSLKKIELSICDTESISRFSNRILRIYHGTTEKSVLTLVLYRVYR